MYSAAGMATCGAAGVQVLACCTSGFPVRPAVELASELGQRARLDLCHLG